jgi:hypothetical protein
MADYLAAVMGPQRLLPFLGDDDGGRWFHPYGDRASFGRTTLVTCKRVFPDAEFSCPDSAYFPKSGLAVIACGEVHVLIDAGPFGAGSAGHSHSDTLSIIARRGEEEILIDPGTFTYVSNVELRNWFRGSAAHNTIRVDGLDQAIPASPFRWAETPRVQVNRADPEFLDAQCGAHRRRVLFLRSDELLLILDDVNGAGQHEVEQSWHLANDAARARFSFAELPAQPVLESGWRSRVYGSRIAAPVLTLRFQANLPVRIAAVLDLSGSPLPHLLKLEDDGLRLDERQVRFPG